MKFFRGFAVSVLLTGLNAASVVHKLSVVDQLRDELAPYLSSRNIISTDIPPRWNTLGAPVPGAVVNIQTESDVATTVKYCTAKGIPILAQNGGIGWALPFNLTKNGVLINMAGLNQVTFNVDKTQATIGGGSNISNTIAHAYASGALVVTGNCNCVGTLGALLGGGYGNLIGLYGLGVDNVISLRVVTADGRLRNVTPTSDPDLFWSLRGAGPNFGIVTSAVVKSYPATEKDMQAWTGSLVFDPAKLEMVVQAIQDLELQPDMDVFMHFLSTSPPTNEPAVVVTPFLYKGNEASGRAAFASLYSIGPKADTTSVLPYDQWNSGGDGFCTLGSRKPSYGAGFQQMIPATWRQVWNQYVAFQKKPTAERSAVLLEAYSLIKARSLDPDSTAFPFRKVNFNAVAIPWYDDPSLDDEAQAFGAAARDLLRSTDGLTQNSTYVNFAHGDETPEVVYGHSLPRLQTTKLRFDPQGIFNQWFRIPEKRCV
ncbi:FAD binding domain-containing protein [Nemania abortiva]|nr:FAD binding domain-containing protein [Nemania abortiva]